MITLCNSFVTLMKNEKLLNLGVFPKESSLPDALRIISWMPTGVSSRGIVTDRFLEIFFEELIEPNVTFFSLRSRVGASRNAMISSIRTEPMFFSVNVRFNGVSCWTSWMTCPSTIDLEPVALNKRTWVISRVEKTKIFAVALALAPSKSVAVNVIEKALYWVSSGVKENTPVESFNAPIAESFVKVRFALSTSEATTVKESRSEEHTSE